MRRRKRVSIVRRLVHFLGVTVGSVASTLAFFLFLPVIQAVNEPPVGDLVVRAVDTAALPPPPPPPPEEQEPEEEPEPEEAPPEMMEEAAPLDLSQLEVALDPGFGGEGWLAGDFAVKLDAVSGKATAAALFSLADLDQEPRVLYQPNPVIDARLRKKAPGTVTIVFVVDERGRVAKPVVQSSTDPVFERSALDAVKQWKFEPGKRNGEAVRFRMRVPITFPKG